MFINYDDVWYNPELIQVVYVNKKNPNTWEIIIIPDIPNLSKAEYDSEAEAQAAMENFIYRAELVGH